MPELDEAKPVDAPRKSAFEGLLFRLDKFKGIEPGGWSVDWKAILNRQVAVMVGLESKADGPDLSLTTEQALARIGYVKAEVFTGLIAIAEMMPEFNNPAESDAFAALYAAKEVLSSLRATAPVAEREGVRS